MLTPLGSRFRVLGSKVPFFALQASQGKQGFESCPPGIFKVQPGLRLWFRLI